MNFRLFSYFYKKNNWDFEDDILWQTVWVNRNILTLLNLPVTIQRIRSFLFICTFSLIFYGFQCTSPLPPLLSLSPRVLCLLGILLRFRCYVCFGFALGMPMFSPHSCGGHRTPMTPAKRVKSEGMNGVSPTKHNR